MCGPFLWGFWWIVPLVGFAICAAFMALMVFRGAGPGCGLMRMGGHRDAPTDRGAESRG